MRRPAKDYVPVLRGKIYCAPFCGGRCTKAAYDAAVALAASIVEALGDEWEPDVHENLGWHCRARSKCGRMSMSVSHDRFAPAYTCFISDRASSGGQWCAFASTPRVAFRKAHASATAKRAAIAAVLDSPAAVQALAKVRR